MKYAFFIFFMVVIGCQQTSSLGSVDSTSDLDFRVDVLYEHTILMEEQSTPEILENIKLNMIHIQKTESLTTIQKIQQMEQAFYIKNTGTQEERITALENRMVEMMQEWYTLVTE